MNEILRLENVTTGYNGHTVLRDITLSVQRGEVLAIIGQNGSGKSTLLKTIARIISNNSGSVIIDGVNIDRLQPWELGERGVAYSMQTGSTFPTFTVKEHFDLALRRATDAEVVSIRKFCFEHFPELQVLMDSRAGNLSGGQRQMLGFAMLLCQQTHIWLLDEPTAGLSLEAVRRSREFMKEMKQHGQTMLLVEHNYSVALDVCDKVAVIKDGEFSGCYARSEFQNETFLDAHLYN